MLTVDCMVGSLLGGVTGDGSLRLRLTRTGDHGVAGPLGNWPLSLTSTRLFIMTNAVLAIFSERIFVQICN